MTKVDTIQTAEGDLEASVGDKVITIRAPKVKYAYLRIGTSDPSDPVTPPGAMYKLDLMSDRKNIESITLWVLFNGKMIRSGEEYQSYMEKHGGDIHRSS